MAFVQSWKHVGVSTLTTHHRGLLPPAASAALPTPFGRSGEFPFLSPAVFLRQGVRIQESPVPKIRHAINLQCLGNNCIDLFFLCTASVGVILLHIKELSFQILLLPPAQPLVNVINVMAEMLEAVDSQR